MFYEVFVKLCEQKGKAITTAAKEIGLAPNAPQKWKEGAVPRIGTMRSIADYFGVPIGVLMEREPEPPPISASVSPVSVQVASFSILHSPYLWPFTLQMSFAAAFSSGLMTE